jgi:uracil-DNA glycosylase family 4
MAKFLPNVFISNVHGEKYTVKWKDNEVAIIPMYHPAASLRNGNILELERNDFYQLKEILRRMEEDRKIKVPESEQMNLV